MREYSESRQVPIKVATCVNCGDNDVVVQDCGYSAFNRGHVKCTNCGYLVNVHGASNNADYIRHWNAERQRLLNERASLLRRIAEIEELKFGPITIVQPETPG